MTTKHLRILVAILLAGVWTARAESSVWVVSSGTSTVYLAGSCHLLRAADYPLPPEFELAYRQANRVALEVSLAEMGTPEAREKLNDCAVYTNGTTIQTHLSPKAYAQVQAFCDKRRYPLARLQSCRPWSLAITLMVLEMQRLRIQPTNGVDRVFDAMARQDGKPVEGLETLDDQIGFLTLIDKELGDDQIGQAITELEELGARLTDLLAAWRKGNEAALQALTHKEFAEYPKLYQALIVDRNRKWTGKIETYLKGPDRVMVIVGAAHLVGDDGVVAMLRKKGYTVKKL
jgi:uncharacterized protein